MASDLSEKVLQYLDGLESIDTLHLAELLSVDHQKVVGAVKSLQALGDVSVAERIIFRSCLECIEFWSGDLVLTLVCAILKLNYRVVKYISNELDYLTVTKLIHLPSAGSWDSVPVRRSNTENDMGWE
jgi:hypothetical protein